MLNIKCVHCHKTLRIPEEYLGQSGTCTHCGGRITVLVEPLKFSPEAIAAEMDEEPREGTDTEECWHGLTSSQADTGGVQTSPIQIDPRDGVQSPQTANAAMPPSRRPVPVLKVGCLAMLLVVGGCVLLMSSSPKTSRLRSTDRGGAQQWFNGGTLHSATVGQWRRAAYENKLATAGDWLAGTKWKGHLNSLGDFERLKVKAKMLVDAVDKVAAPPYPESLIVTELSAAIVTMANDLGP